jgi:hypothetical protein
VKKISIIAVGLLTAISLSASGYSNQRVSDAQVNHAIDMQLPLVVKSYKKLGFNRSQISDECVGIGEGLFYKKLLTPQQRLSVIQSCRNYAKQIFR